MINVLNKATDNALTTSTSSDADSDRDASSRDSFFGCLFAQSKRRRSSNVDQVEEFLSAPPLQTVDANAFMHEELMSSPPPLDFAF